MSIRLIVIMVLAAFAGTFLTILSSALAFCLWKFVKAGKELISGLQNIGKIAESNKELVEMGNTISTEIKLLRSMMAASVQGPSENPREGEAGPSPLRPRTPFPTPGFDLGRIVPDAVLSDTEIIDTTDEQLVTMEKIEELRQQGFEADPSELDGE